MERTTPFPTVETYLIAACSIPLYIHTHNTYSRCHRGPSPNRRDDYCSIPFPHTHTKIYRRCCSLRACVCVRRGRLLGGSNCSLDRADRRVGLGGRYNATRGVRPSRIYTYTFFTPALLLSLVTRPSVVEKRAFF